MDDAPVIMGFSVRDLIAIRELLEERDLATPRKLALYVRKLERMLGVSTSSSSPSSPRS